MVYLSTDWCRSCEKDTKHMNGECSPCSEREGKARIKKWNAMSTKQKMRDLRRRIEKLESGPPTY